MFVKDHADHISSVIDKSAFHLQLWIARLCQADVVFGLVLTGSHCIY